MKVKIIDVQKEIIPLSENRKTIRWLVIYKPEEGLRDHVYIYKDTITEADILEAIRKKMEEGKGLVGKELEI